MKHKKMKLTPTQKTILLSQVARQIPDQCCLVYEVFTTLWSGVDSLFARVAGCRGYDRLWLQKDDKRTWVQCGPETSERIFPKDEREDASDMECICDTDYNAYHEEEVSL